MKRRQEIYEAHFRNLAQRTDRMFAVLFPLQWLMAVVFAVFVSPWTWSGGERQLHVHVYAAIFLGGFLTLYPTYLLLKNPGEAYNRYITAMAQMFFSTLLIHLTAGRIETHFHIFGSLAFIAMYRDPGPLLLATGITALDHLFRGVYWPQSVYGVLTASPLRALEHAAWVIFEDFFLLVAMRQGIKEMKEIANKQSEVESTLAQVEQRVQERTAELMASQKVVMEQQQTIASTAKLSALGEMAGGIAHEINSPLSVVLLRTRQIRSIVEKHPENIARLPDMVSAIEKTAERIASIVKGLRTFARNGEKDPFEEKRLDHIVEDTVSLCSQQFYNNNIKLIIDPVANDLTVECRAVQISQILLNLLSNARHAASKLEGDKWVRLTCEDVGELVRISVTDCGKGIENSVAKKIMDPFFTTKPVGEGTGLGLSISRSIAQEHNGQLTLDTTAANTKFVLSIPKKYTPPQEHSAEAV